MSDITIKEENPVTVRESLQRKIRDGRNLLVENLTDEELVAMHELILEGKAEIISMACRPYLSAKQDRIIISH